MQVLAITVRHLVVKGEYGRIGVIERFYARGYEVSALLNPRLYISLLADGEVGI
jgi:hypothetical protein